MHNFSQRNYLYHSNSESYTSGTFESGGNFSKESLLGLDQHFSDNSNTRGLSLFPSSFQETLRSESGWNTSSDPVHNPQLDAPKDDVETMERVFSNIISELI